ncbi:hypothetical protein [Frankia tisae]|uniref:hypothetical protein n=1 Tax=Frankia tisae TaxID=2950104 RepID=UPI0021C11C06|nr:hypothetical protein [Frankia tisae]
MTTFPAFTHVAVTVTDLAVSVPWYTALFGVDHGGIVDAHYGSGLSLRDPDGIALEFFAPPAGA